MTRYFLSRLGQGVLVLWAAWTLTFILLQLLPGNGVLIKFQDPSLGLSPEQIAQMQVLYGVRTPLWQQYFSSLLAVLRGDFGYSIQQGLPVSHLLRDSLPQTLLLAAPAFVAALILGGGIAVLAFLPGLRFIQKWLFSVPPLLVSLPVFWLGIILIQVFSFSLHWVPVINPSPIVGLILPTLTLAIPLSAPLAQIMIRSLDEVNTRPFISVVRAKGASRTRTLLRHALRNASLPVVTVAGLLLGELIAGALVTETVFGLNGLGQLTWQAVNNQDVAVLQAVVMISALGFVIVNLLVDVLMPWLDPRLHAQWREAH